MRLRMRLSRRQPLPSRRVTRSIDLDAPAHVVWDALTDPDLLADWLAPDVELEPTPGAPLTCRLEDGELRHGVVTEADEHRRLAFTWTRGDGPSQVDLRLTETDDGTRLTVTESALSASASVAGDRDWGHRLESLRRCLASLAYA